ncbi:MAG TPA: metallophosphoesterase [Solirubrobacteraceae bacterium]|nr:metallophosphoesterase [Solirubrobacteraceae bacterium]
MKLLAFSDLHRDNDHAARLVELAGEADIVVGAGDYATMRLGLEGTIETLSAIARPTVLVPGNAESDTQLWRACAVWPSADVLHGQAKEISGAQFFGLGGGIPPTPFPWSFDLSEEEAAEKLEDCPEGAVLVVHSPPKGYVDEVHGRHLGSTSVREAIERKRPALVICGHIHQCWGAEAMIGTTRVLNVGPEGQLLEI